MSTIDDIRARWARIERLDDSGAAARWARDDVRTLLAALDERDAALARLHETLFDRGVELSTTRAALATARREALEDAAGVCDEAAQECAVSRLTRWSHGVEQREETALALADKIRALVTREKGGA